MRAPLKLLYSYRRILLAITWHDIKARYKGTALGLAWTIIYPLLFLGLYAVIYLMVFKIRLPGYTPFEYVLMIFSGLIPFLGFSESLGTGVGSVQGNKGLIRNTMFPIELIPVKAVLSSCVTMTVGLTLLVMILWSHGTVHKTQALLPLIFMFQLLFMIGLIWILSALNVFFQDVGQMVGILILFLMLVSPIAYTLDMVPPALMFLMYPNPLFYMIMLYRGALMIGEFPLYLFVVFSLISAGIFMLGYHVFSRLKPLFADYV